jgi:hypothetical protein
LTTSCKASMMAIGWSSLGCGFLLIGNRKTQNELSATGALGRVISR